MEAVRRAIQNCQMSLRVSPREKGSTGRLSRSGSRMRRRRFPARAQGNQVKRATNRGSADYRCFPPAYVAAGRRLPLSPQPTSSRLTPSSLHRCLQRHDISRLPEVEGSKPSKKTLKAYRIGDFYIDIAEFQTAVGKLHRSTSILPSITSTNSPSCNWS